MLWPASGSSFSALATPSPSKVLASTCPNAGQPGALGGIWSFPILPFGAAPWHRLDTPKSPK